MTNPVIEVHDVHKTFRVGFRRRRVEAVRGVTFAIEPGEVVGLVGHNGAGKTTTLKMITALIRPDAGNVTLFGGDASDAGSRRKLGYMPENPYFYEHLTGRELMRFYGRMFGLGGDELEQRIAELLDKVGIAHAADRPVKKYSKGMRQRVGIAQALVNDPELVILDEPQSGLDPLGRREVRDLVAELHRAGKTILFSSHVLPDVEALATRVVLMAHGRVIASGSVHDLTGEQIEEWEILVTGEAPPDLGELASFQTRGEFGVIHVPAEADVEETVRRVLDAGCRLHSVTPRKTTLETLYVHKTEEAQR